MTHRLTILTACLWVLLMTPMAYGVQSVTLALVNPTNADLAGDKIYQGPASHTYTNIINIGKATNATVTGLLEGSDNYFAATAVSSNGLESDFSNEVKYTVPGTNYGFSTNYSYSRVWQLSYQTDIVFRAFGTPFTNMLPGYPTAVFRLISFSNNIWQAQISADWQHWSNIFGTLLASVHPRLKLTNTATFCVATSIVANLPPSTNQAMQAMLETMKILPPVTQ